jgi:hypothetical protein
VRASSKADVPKRQPGRHRAPNRKQARSLTPPRAVGYILIAAVTVLGLSAAYQELHDAGGAPDALPPGTVYSPPQPAYSEPALPPAAQPSTVHETPVLLRSAPIPIRTPAATLPAASPSPDLRRADTISHSSVSPETRSVRAAAPEQSADTRSTEDPTTTPESTPAEPAPAESAPAGAAPAEPTPTEPAEPTEPSAPPVAPASPAPAPPAGSPNPITPPPLLRQVTGTVITIVNGL